MDDGRFMTVGHSLQDTVCMCFWQAENYGSQSNSLYQYRSVTCHCVSDIVLI